MKKPTRPSATRPADAGLKARVAERQRIWDERIVYWDGWVNTRSLTKKDLDFDSLRNIANDFEREICLFYEYSRESPTELAGMESSRGDNPELVRILAEGHAEHWGKHTFPDCLRGLCDKWPNTSWLELPVTERKRIVDMVDNPLRDVPKFEPDEIGFSGRPIFRNYGSFSEDDWKALNWFRDNQDWTSPFKLVRDGNQKRIYAVLNLDCSESAGKHGKRLKNWMATCLRAAKIRQRNWRKGRKSARLVEMFGLNGSPLDLLHALAALRLHRRHKNFEKACELSKQLTKKPIYANERKWQAAIRKARHALQTIFPVPK